MTPAGRSVLRDGNILRLLFLGNVVEMVRWAELLAASVFIFEATQSALLVALLVFVRSIPMILFGTINGALAERFNSRALMIGYVAIMTGLSAILALLAHLDMIALWQVFLGAFVGGAFFSSDHPVRRTMIGDVAGPGRTMPAIGIDTSTRSGMRGVGPLVGGVLLQTLGLEGAYLLGTLLYGVSLAGILTMTFRPTPAARRREPFLTTVTDGIRYVRKVPLIMAILLGTLIMNLLAFSYLTMVPVIGHAVLELSPTAIGLLQGLEGAGAAIGSAVLAVVARPRHYGQIFFCGSLLVCAGAFAFSLSTSFGFSLAMMFLAGLGLAGFANMQNTVMLIVAEPGMRSRAMGALTAAIGLGPFGALHIGFLADHFGAATAVSVVMIEAAVGLVLLAWLIPAVRRPYLPGEAAR
jgi:MFS family permease